MSLSGTEIVLCLVDWASVKKPMERPAVFRSMASVFPGKHVILVSKDPLKKDAPAEFFGHAQLVALFNGRKVTDFKWQTVKY
jgi:hypothetical protein